MYLHVRILEFGQQARVSGRDSEPDRGGFFAQLAHSGYATAEAHALQSAWLHACTSWQEIVKVLLMPKKRMQDLPHERDWLLVTATLQNQMSRFMWKSEI